MQPVQSSNIAAIGHDPSAGTLAVRFVSGGVYHYPDVPAEEHAAFAGAKSVGQHFITHIRPKYQGVLQVENEQKEG